MAGWTKLPVTTAMPPAAQHMDELREAWEERSEVHEMGAFGGGVAVGPTDVAVGDYGRHMEEYQGKYVALIEVHGVPIGGSTFFCADEANGFKSLVAGTPGTGEMNVFGYAFGGGQTDWRKKAPDDPGDIRHPNDIKLLADKMLYLKTHNFFHSDPHEPVNDGSTMPKTGLGSDEDWETARDEAFTSQSHPGPGYNFAEPIIGRTGADLAGIEEEQINVATSLACEAEIDLSDAPAGAEIDKAWLIFQTLPVITGTGAESEEFQVEFKVGGASVGTRWSDDAADITDFVSPDGDVFDAWKLEIADVSKLSLTGPTTVRLELVSPAYDAIPTGWTQGKWQYFNCPRVAGDSRAMHYCLVIKWKHFDYKPS